MSAATEATPGGNPPPDVPMQAAAAARRLTRRSDYRPPAFLIERADLRFDLAFPTTRVTSTLHFRRAIGGEGASLVLDGERIKLVELRLDGELMPPERYTLTAEALAISDPPERGELVITTDVTPADTGMEGLVHLNEMFVTHCEPAGFRRITYFPDRPDVLARFRCTLVADPVKHPTLLSNGDPVAAGALPDGRHFATWQDPYPKASYLFALVAGRFAALTDSFVTRSGRRVELAIHAQPEDLPLCRHGMAVLKRAMTWDEQAYGLEYDLDVLNVAVMRGYPGGAMENKGLNLYSSESFLGSAGKSTDEALLWTEQVIAHEYFHNWTGNRVGCRDWFELSLKEGFTIFRQQQFFAAKVGFAVGRIDTAIRIREFQFREDEGGMAHAVRPASYLSVNNLYTHTVYEKGAELIRMMQSIAGERAFTAAAGEFFRRHDGTAVTIDTLIETLEQVAGIDLTQFRRWYDAVGGVTVRAAGVHDADQQRYTLTLTQASEKVDRSVFPLQIPLRLGLLGPDGQALPLRLAGAPEATETDRVLQLRAGTETFVFEGIPVAPTPSLFRGFSAPVRLECDLHEDALELLATRDEDAVNRWDAAQRLAARALLDRARQTGRNVRTAQSQRAEEAWFRSFAATLARDELDPGFASRVLQLPSERQLGLQQAEIDVDGLHSARLSLAAGTARRFRAQLRAKYRELTDAAADDDAYGARRLRNLALWYLMQDAGEEEIALCWTQFQAADRMENTVAALRLLIDRGGSDREEALRLSYAWWQSTPSQIDQWFAAQAASEAADCAQRVRQLTGHSAYSLENGTRLKIFFDTFAQNQSALHHRSGEGYEIFAGLVLDLNRSNPRLAARFLKSLDAWHRFDEHRRGRIREALQRVLDVPGLADNLYEIASQSLRLGIERCP